jgi:hypothetical protein
MPFEAQGKPAFRNGRGALCGCEVWVDDRTRVQTQKWLFVAHL